MKILFFQWNAYMQKDITHCFDLMNIDYQIISYNFRTSISDPYMEAKFPEKLLADQYDAVFSLNYLAFLADICYKYNVKYICWIYDSPIEYKRSETLVYPTNRAFFFDRNQYQYYKNKGYDTVFHMPLGVAADRLDNMEITKEDEERYTSDISFVGKIYETDIQQLYDVASEYEAGYITAVCDAQQRVYGYNFINELITDKMIRSFSTKRIIKTGGYSGSLVREQVYYAMCTKVTQQERLEILKRVSEGHSMDLYTTNFPEGFPNVRNRGTVDYSTEMPKVFRLSRINLNITLKCIESGIPLRALDILASGGFLLTNYQPEIAEYFKEGEEVVSYESMDDLVEKVDYYLAHEEERAQIAVRGHDRVQALFNYRRMLTQIFTACGLEFCDGR